MTDQGRGGLWRANPTGPCSARRLTRGRLALHAALIAAAAAGMGDALSAQTPAGAHLVSEVGAGSWDGQLTGIAALGAGISGGAIRLVVNPAAVAIQSADERLYQRQFTPEGVEYCRNTETGSTAPESFCSFLNSDFTWIPSAELQLSTASIGVPLWLGVGARKGGDSPLIGSLTLLPGEFGPGQVRLRAVYSRNAWHLGFGLMVGGR